MIDIFIFVPTSLPFYPPISPSITEVRSVAMYNVEEVTPNHLSQQIYETLVLNEDVDLKLSDEELESVAGNGNSLIAIDANTSPSDVFVDGVKIIDYNDFISSNPDPREQLKYICNRLPAPPINKECCLNQAIQCPEGRNDYNTAEVIRLQLVAPAVKQQYPRGFNINLTNGQVKPR